MHIYHTFVMSAVILIGITAVANASPVPEQSPEPQFAALTPDNGTATTTTEAPVVTYWAPQSYYYDPYAGGQSECASGTLPGGVLKCVDIIPLSHPTPLSQPIH